MENIEKVVILSVKKAYSIGILAVMTLTSAFLLHYANSGKSEMFFSCGVRTPPFPDSLKEGKSLFINNCASCHAKDMQTELTAPPLKNWQQYLPDEQAFADYIHNPKQYKAKHRTFRKAMRAYASTEKMSFKSLSKDEIRAIIAYIQYNSR